jgi:hypothetical protein
VVPGGVVPPGTGLVMVWVRGESVVSADAGFVHGSNGFGEFSGACGADVQLFADDVC